MGMDLMDIAVLNAKAACLETAAGLGAAQEKLNAALTDELDEMHKRYNSLIDKYNKVVENCEAARAARDFYEDVIRENLDHIPLAKEEINKRCTDAVRAAVQRVRDSIS